jgi:hypothetical protein
MDRWPRGLRRDMLSGRAVLRCLGRTRIGLRTDNLRCAGLCRGCRLRTLRLIRCRVGRVSLLRGICRCRNRMRGRCAGRCCLNCSLCRHGATHGHMLTATVVGGRLGLDFRIGLTGRLRGCPLASLRSLRGLGRFVAVRQTRRPARVVRRWMGRVLPCASWTIMVRLVRHRWPWCLRTSMSGRCGLYRGVVSLGRSLRLPRPRWRMCLCLCLLDSLVGLYLRSSVGLADGSGLCACVGGLRLNGLRLTIFGHVTHARQFDLPAGGGVAGMLMYLIDTLPSRCTQITRPHILLVRNPFQVNGRGSAIGKVLGELQGGLLGLLFVLRVREASSILDRVYGVSSHNTAKEACAIRALYQAGP